MVEIFALLPVIINEHEPLDLLFKVCDKNRKKGENARASRTKEHLKKALRFAVRLFKLSQR